jgi:putative transposase
VKYDEVYRKACQDGREAKAALADYFRLHKKERPQQALGCQSPAAVYNSNRLDKVPMSLILSKRAPRTAEPHLNVAPVPSCPEDGGHFAIEQDTCSIRYRRLT